MHALKVLEFDAIRARLQAHCETTLATASAADLEPSFVEQDVWELLETTAEAYEALGRHSVPSLGAVRDLRDALTRSKKGGILGGQELYQIADAMSAIRQLRAFLEPRREDMPRLQPFSASLPENRKVEEQLYASLDPDGTVRDDASTALANLRQKKKAAAARITERIQAYISGRTRDLLSDPIYTVRDGRYVIPLKAENRGKIRGIVHDTSASGQTIYLEPEDVLQLGNALREVEAAERIEVQKVLTALSGKVGSIASETIGGIEAAATVDLHFAKARLGFEMKGTMPQRAQGTAYLKVQGGKHPLLDQATAVPLDIAVGKGKSVLITGPNTGGKTVSIKTVGLFVLMAQSGLMPPALDIRLAPFTQAWADIGDEQSLQQSLSTFSGHIRNIAEALKRLKDGSLVLLDEVGAGTDPAEGAALAKAILQAMSAKGATVLASTHYGELKAFAYNEEGFENAAMEFDPKTFRPTYRLIMGAPGASHALRIAERYGIPAEVVEQAREGLGDQAQDLALMMERLEQSQRQARVAQSEADKRSEQLKRSEQKAAKKLAEAEEIRQTAHSRANEVIEAALREIRLEASRLFEELKQAPIDPKTQQRVRQSLRDLDAVGRDFAGEFVPKRKGATSVPEGLVRGSLVKVDGYSQIGTVLEEPREGRVFVQLGPLKMTVPAQSLSLADRQTATSVKPRTNIQLQKTINATTEIQLIQKRAEEAIRELERFVDDSMMSGVPSIRIVHGKGEGILRKVTQEFLRSHPGVAAFRDGEPSEGGQGVTIATFK
ncbi:endonuclease MutS2 [Fimbriimonas ginsengisoli]|uniref:Endonuclease MutS2 n=1 Tax=Fimbriimonas ginsengisoli Gsoil 348 TaxID=661478 RepID=A0A068NXT0_FIMGI|nr:endonuclease MutS2 [Fimbriimonas ginsengisoli]AIE86454.1 Recombination inhibitory protein MutS2 [Fimbriimonas ginsengisoli Gsoil 348]